MTKEKINNIFDVILVMSANANSVVVILETWLYDNWSATFTMMSFIVMVMLLLL